MVDAEDHAWRGRIEGQIPRISHADICVLYIEMLNSMKGCRHYLQFRALVEPTWVSAGPRIHPGSLKIADTLARWTRRSAHGSQITEQRV